MGYAPPSLGTGPYMFLLEALGADEVEHGRNAVGPTGGVFNKLLHENTSIQRKDQTIANVVRCRPIAWTVAQNGQQVPMMNRGGYDHIHAKPTPGQIRECAARYTDAMIDTFQGKWIIALGNIPLQYLAGRPLSIQKYRGSIMSPGKLKPCAPCGGTGKVPGKTIKCKACSGRTTLKCECGGLTKHRKWCHSEFPKCETCTAGLIPGKPKKCTNCDASGQVAADAATPLVSPKLREGQLAFLTYHPALVKHEPKMETVVARDFARIPNLDSEMAVYTGTDFISYPPAPPKELEDARLISVDLETRGKDPHYGEIQMVAVTHKPHYGAVFRPEDPWVRRWLGDPSRTIIGQNFVLFDQKWLEIKGFEINARVFDTRFGGKLLNPDTPNDIYYLAGEFADPPMPGYWKSRNDYRDHLEQVAAIDVDAAFRIYNGQQIALRERDQLHLAEGYAMPLAQIALDMQMDGIRVNDNEIDRLLGTAKAPGVLVQDLSESRSHLPDGITSEGQHQKIQEFLYDTLRLPVMKNKDGKRTADTSALKELLGRVSTGHISVRGLSDTELNTALRFIERVKSLRDKTKFLGFVKAYSDNRSGWLHPELNPLGTGTLRWTSKEPNCQQVPTCKCAQACYGTNPRCKGARSLLLPDGDDWEIMVVDLRQAEVIGMLWHAEAWAVLDKILKGGLDAHFAVGQAILGRDPTKAERDSFKTTTFAILYGEQDRTTAYRLGIPLEEVQRVRELYFRMLPGVLEARNGFIRQAGSQGYVGSCFGVRRYIRVEREVGRAANQAANAPIQNIPPMVIGYKMLGLHRYLPKPARLWLQVHDEVDLVYPRALRQEVIECVKEIMSQPVPQMPAAPLGMAGGLRFPVDIEIGPNWGAVSTVST